MPVQPRLEELRRRLQRDPASISFAPLAEEYRRQGQFREAIETCRAGLQRHPAYVSARVTLGRALLETGEYDSAASELERVLQAAPENLAAIRALADIHRRRRERSSQAAAIPVESAVVTMPPDSPALVGLEAFLAAIDRVRHDVSVPSGR